MLSSYSMIRDSWKKLKKSDIYPVQKARMVSWRKSGSVVRLDYPTRLDRARSLGYKAKQGFIIVRSRVRKGGQHRPKIMGGRRPRRLAYNKLTVKKSIQLIAEERAADKYPNMEVLNSYYVGEDGLYKYYEVILIDRSSPAVLSDKNVSWIANSANKGRVYRGLTSAGYKSRGLGHGRLGSAKSRPSIRANGRLRR
ncbi:50S ribosomal protein L15e [Picrophilus oshimae]|uniref:Large ribosomal subunit protein eL15 n=2 Tax=Picrophilus torridus (strain ATCC 700027 / DSM 9790 / JCM 10055 / NBRC 100828 / KAW 2/3) TaxID=1122961 RepID=RL15E_PICTO|nr:50S ribosomal protein L15e [Picrophilus oshimae]Q6L0P2.1 RecName: Full=Large ribosomal subunit protein eL15; AltName: Full=50S ribosomal protein L15e [Picrophilus oshimae DSM 9789]AAT43460.1 large subunit ribosomal protein L15E [Picrophilus oshimae DSM 9789]SMD30231.1 LSU ribosomal protein L15E [Picrophilus oshimae DSM 9789]